MADLYFVQMNNENCEKGGLWILWIIFYKIRKILINRGQFLNNENKT